MDNWIDLWGWKKVFFNSNTVGYYTKLAFETRQKPEYFKYTGSLLSLRFLILFWAYLPGSLHVLWSLSKIKKKREKLIQRQRKKQHWCSLTFLKKACVFRGCNTRKCLLHSILKIPFFIKLDNEWSERKE